MRLERGKPAGVTLVCDDQRCDPLCSALRVAALGSPGNFSEFRTGSVPSLLCCSTDLELPACPGRAGYLAFPNRNRAA